MKIASSLNILLMAAQWLLIAQSNVRCAMHSTGQQRAKHLSHASADAARFRSYSAMWWRSIESQILAA